MLIQHPPLENIPTRPYVCLLHEPPRTHYMLCRDCAEAITNLYYHQNGQRAIIRRSALKGARLAVYVELQRLGASPTLAIHARTATIARTIHYAYHTVQQALIALQAAGYIERISSTKPRRHSYRVLLQQLPKGE